MKFSNKCMTMAAVAVLGFGWGASQTWAGLEGDKRNYTQEGSTTQGQQQDPTQDRNVVKEDSATFETLDKNRDNYLTKVEVQVERTLTDQFDQLDANNDDKLSREEFSNHKQHQK